MRIIGVLDILDGQVVAARAGHREQYQPIRTPLCPGSAPADVARAFAEQLAIDEFYLADLDRLAGREPNVDAWQSAAQFAKRVWLDVGLLNPADVDGIQQQISNKTTLICATESWQAAPLPFATSNPLAFGLDLRDGKIISANKVWQAQSPLELLHSQIDAGCRHFVLLDIVAVGTDTGCPTIRLCQQLRGLSDEIEIVTGGGIRHRDDLQRLEDAGCDAALVSTALHRKQISN